MNSKTKPTANKLKRIKLLNSTSKTINYLQDLISQNTTRVLNLIKINRKSYSEQNPIIPGEIIDLTKEESHSSNNKTDNHSYILKTCLEDCSICLSKQFNVLFECNHNICYQCSEKWIKIGNFCPICRRKIKFII